MTVTQAPDGKGVLRSPSGAVLAVYPDVDAAWRECGAACREFDRLVRLMPTNQLTALLTAANSNTQPPTCAA